MLQKIFSLKFPSIFISLLLLVAIMNLDQMSFGSDRFVNGERAWVEWVQKEATPISAFAPSSDYSDLEPFRDIVGSASVVGLGESDHGLHEIQGFRNRLFKFLVTEMDFRAISLESGVLEAQIVEKYIHGDSSVTLEDALKKGITHGMGLCQEVKDLLLWMKKYNSAQVDPTKKIHFFGFDQPVVGDAPLLPLQELSSFLKKIAPEFYREIYPSLLELSEKAFSVTKLMRAATKKEMKRRNPDIDIDTVEIDPDYLDAYGTIGFDQLTKDEQSRLEDGVSNVIQFMEKQKIAQKLTTLEDVEQMNWNIQLAKIAAQHIRNFRSRQRYHKVYFYARALKYIERAGFYDELKNIDFTYDMDITSADDLMLQLKGRETRELMAAENVILGQKRFGKSLLYAHVGHLLKTPIAVQFGDINLGKEAGKGQGDFLLKNYGTDYAFIAASVGEFINTATPSNAHNRDYEPLSNCENCIEKAFLELCNSNLNYVVNLKHLDSEAKKWFNEDRKIRWASGFQGLDVLEGVDALIYIAKERQQFVLRDND